MTAASETLVPVLGLAFATVVGIGLGALSVATELTYAEAAVASAAAILAGLVGYAAIDRVALSILDDRQIREVDA